MMFFVLWFVATWYFWGDLGKWTDDWSFHLRKPGTGEIDWTRMFALDPWGSRFWRPFHIRVASTLQALLWHWDWAIHLILAVLHGLNTWLLWRVLLRFCASRRSAAIGALLFLVCPVGYEAIFWMSTVGTGAGLASFLFCVLAAQRFAAGEIGWKRLLLYIPVVLTLAWWYEQPAACGPAIGMAYLACAPAAVPVVRRLRTATILAGVAMLCGILHVTLFLATAGPSQRGNAGSIVNADTVIPHAGLIWRQTVDHITLRGFAPGALRHGWQQFWGKPLQASAVVAVFGLASLMFGSWWMRGRAAATGGAGVPDHPFRSTVPTPFQRVMALAFGLSIFAASLVPVIAVSNQWFCGRLAYIPVAGLIVALVVLIDPLLGAAFAQSRGWLGRMTRGVTLAALLPALVAGAVMLVGVQSIWHRRANSDERLIAQLRKVVPNPPSHAVFVPVTIRDRLCATGSPRFDLFQTGPYEASWSAMYFTRGVYGRRDLHGLAFSRWSDIANAVDGVVGANEEGVVLRKGYLYDSPFPVDAQGRRTVPWSHIIPIRITRHGRLTLPGSIRIESPENPAHDRVVQVSSIPIPGMHRDRGGVIIALRESVAPADRLEWTLVRTPAAAAPEVPATKPVWASGRILECFAIHPAIASMTMPTAAVAELEASAYPRRLAWRAGVMDYLWRVEKPLTDGIGLSVWLDGRDQPLARELITPARLRKAQDWIPIVVEIPPLDRPTRVRIEIDPGPKTDPSCDWCLLTPPVITPGRGASAATVTADPDTTPPSAPAHP